MYRSSGRRPSRVVAVLAALSVIVAACGSDDEDDTSDDAAVETAADSDDEAPDSTASGSEASDSEASTSDDVDPPEADDGDGTSDSDSGDADDAASPGDNAEDPPATDDVDADTPAADGVSAAQSLVDELSRPPTDLGLPSDAPSVLPEGKTFYVISDGTVPPIAAITDSFIEASGELGAEAQHLTFSGGCGEDFIAQWDRAVAEQPDGVAVVGCPAFLAQAQVEELNGAGIPVVTSGSRLEGDPTPGVSGYDFFVETGRTWAAWIAADSGGEADVMFMTFPQIPAIDAGERAGLAAGFEEFCTSCNLAIEEVTLDQQFTGQLGDVVVSYLQANPETDYVVSQGAALATGVAEALSNAGLSDVVLLGQGGDPRNWSAIVSGGEAADIGASLTFIGWQLTDLLVRAVNGDDLTEAEADPFVSQIIGPDTASELLESGAVSWEPPGFRDAYRALWGI